MEIELPMVEGLLIYMYLFTISLYYPSQLYLLSEPNLLMSTKVYNYLNNITLKTNEFTYIFIQAYFIMQLFNFFDIIYYYLSNLKSGIYSDLIKKKYIVCAPTSYNNNTDSEQTESVESISTSENEYDIYMNESSDNYTTENDNSENDNSENDNSENETSENDTSENETSENDTSENDTSENDTSEKESDEKESDEKESDEKESDENDTSENDIYTYTVLC
jgi:hypothetical protein